MLKPPSIKGLKPSVEVTLATSVNTAVRYYHRNKGRFEDFLPAIDCDGKPIGIRRLKSIRRHVKQWENHRIEPDKAISLINKPLAAFFDSLPLQPCE